MILKTQNKTKKLTISAIIIALYIVLMYVMQGFSFGAYQIRLATALYALAYFDPFFILPLGISNFLSNTFFGGLGPFDMIGGGVVGIITASLTYMIGRWRLPDFLICPLIILIPGLGVSTWLSAILKIPYPVMALNLVIGQIIPGIIGVILVKFFKRREAI